MNAMNADINPIIHGLSYHYLALKAINWAESGGNMQPLQRYANAINMTRTPEDMPTVGEIKVLTSLFTELTDGIDCASSAAVVDVANRAKTKFS